MASDRTEKDHWKRKTAKSIHEILIQKLQNSCKSNFTSKHRNLLSTFFFINIYIFTFNGYKKTQLNDSFFNNYITVVLCTQFYIKQIKYDAFIFLAIKHIIVIIQQIHKDLTHFSTSFRRSCQVNCFYLELKVEELNSCKHVWIGIGLCQSLPRIAGTKTERNTPIALGHYR